MAAKQRIPITQKATRVESPNRSPDPKQSTIVEDISAASLHPSVLYIKMHSASMPDSLSVLPQHCSFGSLQRAGTGGRRFLIYGRNRSVLPEIFVSVEEDTFEIVFKSRKMISLSDGQACQYARATCD